MKSNLNADSKDLIVESLKLLKEHIKDVSQLDNSCFDEVIALWHETLGELKDAVFDKKNKQARINFEEGWGAQSVQFVIDCIPEFHRILLHNYKRSDELTLLDVGAGSGLGSNLFTALHSENYVYSKVSVDAIDYTDSRLRWVQTMYPKVNYKVADVYDLPDNHWDMFFCSHVIEHVTNPKAFIEKLVNISRGFVFVYSPYNEIDRIPAHINTITESLYEGFDIEKINIFKSMGWHADIPEDLCILAVIDCRKKSGKGST